jgi:hypothetical protein
VRRHPARWDRSGSGSAWSVAVLGCCAHLADPVSQVDHAVAEPALVQQFQLKVETGGQRARPPAHHDGIEEEVALVHQAGRERVRREPRTPDGDVPPRGFFQPADCVRVELPLEPGPRAGNRVQRRRVDDLSAACQIRA